MTRAAQRITRAILLLLALQPAITATRYVDVNSANPTPPFTNWATAARVIQNALDAAAMDDQVRRLVEDDDVGLPLGDPATHLAAVMVNLLGTDKGLGHPHGLDKALGRPVRPVLAIVGGAKVSSKIDLLRNLVTKVDALAIGAALEKGDIASALTHFDDDCYWRDLVAFTWNIRTQEGHEAVRDMLTARQTETGASNFQLDGEE